MSCKELGRPTRDDHATTVLVFHLSVVDPVAARYWWTRIAMALATGLHPETLHEAILETLAITPDAELAS